MSPLVRIRDDDEAVGSVARNKKRNAALSCAECRRLKLRCDRKFPCSACVKRGCSQICPEGSLTTGKGNRFVLANTEALHEKINELAVRVRSLEDALSIAHRAISNERHPLLSDELMMIKNPLEREVTAEPVKTSEEEDAIDAVGSLSISHNGRANFYGQTANAWYLLQNEEGELPDDELDGDFALPTDIPWLSHSFPFTPSVNQTAEELRNQLISTLPDEAQARHLTNCYFENAAWMYHPLSRTEFDETIFARIYDPNSSPTEYDPIESHHLAVLFAIFAVGTLVDLSIRSHSTAAKQYCQLTKAALSLDSVFDEPSISSIQALLILCHYMFLDDVDGPRWTLMGLVVKLAQSVGLHRDSTRWNLCADETQRRRELFWEIYVYDSWQSLTYGRPPSLTMAHIDCKMAHETAKNAQGIVEMSFDAWKHRFSSECLSIVHDQVFGARTPSYSTIMELDKRVRTYPVPPSLTVPGFGGSASYLSSEQPSLPLTMQRHIILAIKEVTLLYMHRGFFAKAMNDHPEDPLSGKYGQSVLCAHRSASSFVALVKSMWSQHRALTERNWFLFTHVFSCAIVLGSIPTRCPSMGLARSALQSLDQAYELFMQVEERSRTSRVMPILRKLRERAHVSMDEFLGQQRDALTGTKREPLPDTLFIKQEDEELATLGGKTRLVSPRPGMQSPTSSRGSRSPLSSPVTGGVPSPPTTRSQTLSFTETSPTQPYTVPSQMNSLTGYNLNGQVHNHTNYSNGSHSHVQPQQQAQVHNVLEESPEMSLYTMPVTPQDAQQAWQGDPTLGMGYYTSQPMVTDAFDSAVSSSGSSLGMQTQYGYDYISMSAPVRQGSALGFNAGYGSMQGYLQSPGSSDALSPAAAELDAAWQGWYAQFTTTTS